MSIHTRGCPRQNDETSTLILESKMSAQKKKIKNSKYIPADKSKQMPGLNFSPAATHLTLLQYESLNYAFFFFFLSDINVCSAVHPVIMILPLFLFANCYKTTTDTALDCRAAPLQIECIDFISVVF